MFLRSVCNAQPLRLIAFPALPRVPCCARLVRHALYAAEEPLATDLAAQVWQYLTTEDGEQARAVLTTILQRSDATVPAVQGILRKGQPHGLQPVGMLPDEQIVVRDRPYRYSLSVPQSYEPTKDYALVVCLHGAASPARPTWIDGSLVLGENYILVCPTYPAGAWFTRRAEDLVLAVVQTVRQRYRIDPNRIFLSGMSNGGIGAWLIGVHHAPLFAGLAPMASGIDDAVSPFWRISDNAGLYHPWISRSGHAGGIERKLAAELKHLGYPFIYREHDRTHAMAGGHFSRGKNSLIW